MKKRTTEDYLFFCWLILSGMIGDGEERKKQAEALGFNYEKVQSIINAAYK